jgi:phosphoribosylcarboxyaminoimidazole (NCAIR) mutase
MNASSTLTRLLARHRHRHGLQLRLADHAGRAKILKDFGVPFEARVVSAHRTPDLMFEYAEAGPRARPRAIIAGPAAPPTCRA